MNVVFVASEVAPWSKTGGLGDVLGALPRAVQAVGRGRVEAIVVTPLYRDVRAFARTCRLPLEDAGIEFSVRLEGQDVPGRVKVHRVSGRPTLAFIDCPRFFDRMGIYGAARRGSYAHGGPGAFADNGLRFAFLARGAIEAATRLLGQGIDVFHCHDWQAALLPVYLRTRYEGALPHAATVLTIHNLAYQGEYPPALLQALDLDGSLWHSAALEHHGQLNMLKGGIAFSDVVTTVSPRYAEEIKTDAFGCGLQGFLRKHAGHLFGILNGIDTDEWNPSTDRYLAASYSSADLEGKRVNRQALLAKMGVDAEPGDVVLGLVARFDHQKGVDLVFDLVPHLDRLGARLVMLGTGDPDLEAELRRLACRYPERLRVRIDFDTALAHLITAGADIFLMPSRFEPCGLNQLYAMRYGTIPVVHGVGGLADTVDDPGDAGLARGEGTGFVFDEATPEALHRCVARAVNLFRRDPEGWVRLVRAGMERDDSWTRSAREYLRLYEGLVEAESKRRVAGARTG